MCYAIPVDRKHYSMNTQEAEELSLEDHLLIQEACLRQEVRGKEAELLELKRQLLCIQQKLNRPEQYQVSL